MSNKKRDIALQTHDLTIGYKRARQADLIIGADINLSLKAGELVCLLGPNGAGKSTLMRTLARMQAPLMGSVTLKGEDITTLKPIDLAKRLSIVLTERPDTGLMTGYDLIALGRHPYTDWAGRLSEHDLAMIDWAIDAVNARELVASAVNELSDGQRQKIMIARALAQDPALILLDEPTAFLDLPRRVEVMRLLKQLSRQTERAILLSTHDLDLALRTADKLWLMPQDGAIQVGAPEDLILSGVFAEVFSSEGVEFDMQSGTFKVQDVQAGQVTVIGAGMRALWTRRALVREGYQVGDEADDSLVQIHVRDDDGWQVRHANQVRQCASIHEVLKVVASVIKAG